MGIAGLARRLEPYATRYSDQQLEGYTAIIDGPSLAYQAHKLALSGAASQLRIPSYADINNEGIRWLCSLEDRGIEVSEVLFDGALPVSKRAERLARTEQNNRRIQQLRASYASTACPVPTYLGSTSYAFLAPSLREALSNAQFASRSKIVPGEADDYCGLLAKNIPRSIIFTSDTDLLLFDYHAETLIVLFQDVDSLAGIKAYSPRLIAQNLKLKSLVPFAWVIQQRTSDGQNDLISDACSVDTEAPAYLEFSRRYTEAVIEPAYVRELTGPLLPLQELDVRVSEFVHSSLLKSPDVFIYLPLLVEDPIQASAWNVAQHVRVLAYSLLGPLTSTIQEYRRKAQGISPQTINTYSATDLGTPAKEVEFQLSALFIWAEPKNLTTELLWMLFAVSFVLSELNTPPAIPLLSRVLNGDFDNTWVFIQLAARIHAAMYSLRMLKQIIAVRLIMDRATSPSLSTSLLVIAKHMSTLPSLPDMFGVPGQVKRVSVEHSVMIEYIKEIYQSTGIEIPAEQVSNRKKKKQAREAERKQRKADQRQRLDAALLNSFGVVD
ncbi:hypothetical protein EK21DRAFT_74713 [Setomelanomma holmii]|uniref:Asteroid domain-containing protein n=1 Tax=Setomelanomma holmii TaxID=210430 RepID=A0A9P4H3U4_9PLEO|nr:hypothetical protein EK21DRAFT_74713 [Setomelanomma holmii]